MTRGRTKVIRSDHYPVIIQLEGLPRAGKKETSGSHWNLNKPGGWELYKLGLEEAAEKMNDIIDDESRSIEEVMKKVDAIMDSVKFQAFGKTKPMTKKAIQRRLEVRLAAAQGLDGQEKVREIMRKQFDQLEDEINKLKENKFGRITNVFKMREIVAGPKKAPQEAHAVIDKETNELVVSSEGIKKVTLRHCMKTLKDNDPEKDVEQLVNVIKEVHESRMGEDDDDSIEVTKEEFDTILERFKSKKKKSYDFLLKAGDGFKTNIFKLCGRIIQEEVFPDRFYDTVLQQLWKRKFPREDLGNHRFLHLKDWLPKTCEAMIVSKMKPLILEAGTKYQIGGLPGHRVEEHLITLKAIISRGIETGGGVIVNLVDIKTFFDSESLRGVMNSLYTAGVPMKAYRTWFKLNSRTVISVRTPSGQTETEEAGELCAQGSGGAALASQLDIDLGLDSHFAGSRDEAKYGSVRVRPQAFQDDILRVAQQTAGARAGAVKLSSMLRERLLRCHPTKTCYIVIGNKSYKQRVQEDFKQDPLRFGDLDLSEKSEGAYLGDIISSGGLAASIEATIASRLAKTKGAIFETAAIMKDFRMQVVGGLQGAFDIWERAIIPSLMANSGSWVAINKSALKTLTELQNLFCRLAYSCPGSTPLPALLSEAGLLSMDHRVMSEKVSLVTKILNATSDQEENYARDILQEQLNNGWDGLTKEVIEICKKVGLPNGCTQYIPMDEIKKAIMMSNAQEIKEQMQGLTKLENIMQEDLRFCQDYIKSLSLEDARLEFRWRTGMLDNRANMGRRYSGKTCPHCEAGREDGAIESSQHWLSCEAYVELRAGLDPEYDLDDRVVFLRRVQIHRTTLEKELV